MTQADTPDVTILTEQEIKALAERLRHSNLAESDKELVIGSLKATLWLRRKYMSGKIGFHKLATLLFGKKTEKNPRSPSDSTPGSSDTSKTSDASASAGETSCETSPAAAKEKPKGHGRLAASVYENALDIFVSHPLLKPDDLCPEECGGRLYERDSGVIIRIAAPENLAKRYHIQKLRCGTCGLAIHTPLPEDAKKPKYDHRFKATLGVQKYFLGVPFYRQEAFFDLIKLPLSDATQWKLIDELATCVRPIMEALETEAAQGEWIANDDTPVKILNVMKLNKLDPTRARKGMFTTGIYALVGARTIVLYYSGVHHAGENLARILAKRPPDLPPIIHMCDALSRNITPAFLVVLSHCLSHGRRKFKDIEAFFPIECAPVIEAFGKVYHHEALIQEKNLSALGRLAYHQEHSAPVMADLKNYLLKAQPLTEPNGDLYRAMAYLLKHWDPLTLFLRVPGAFLDNNRLEAALKIPVRLRKNSLFHRSLHGAEVASILMSAIETCRKAHINPIDYMVALQDHQEAVARDPHAWLPWLYQERLASIQSSSMANLKVA